MVALGIILGAAVGFGLFMFLNRGQLKDLKKNRGGEAELGDQSLTIVQTQQSFSDMMEDRENFSLIQREFVKLESQIVNEYVGESRGKVNLSVYRVLIEMLSVIENEINKFSTVVMSNRVYNMFKDDGFEDPLVEVRGKRAEEWVKVAEEMRLLTKLVSKDYLKNLLENPEVWGDESSAKVAKVPEMTTRLLKSIQKANRNSVDTDVEVVLARTESHLNEANFDVMWQQAQSSAKQEKK